MKSLLLLALGGVCGAVATVVLFTVDPNFDGTEADGAGGGNATLSLSEEAIATLVERELPAIPAFGERPQVVATVGTNGVIVLNITVGGLGVGFRGRLTVNPEIQDGRLAFEVVDARLGELGVPAEVADLLEGPFNQRIEALAGGVEHRVTAIRTTDRRLTIEVEI